MKLKIVVCLVLCSCLQLSLTETACNTHDLRVLFDVYNQFNFEKWSTYSNGCWKAVAPIQQHWWLCGFSKNASGNPRSPYWTYDDTSPRHNLTEEVAKLKTCGASHRKIGFQFMSRRDGAWRKVSMAKTEYLAEIYSSEFAMMDYLDFWMQNRSLGWPFINVGHWNYTEVYTGVKNVCQIVINTPNSINAHPISVVDVSSNGDKEEQSVDKDNARKEKDVDVDVAGSASSPIYLGLYSSKPINDTMLQYIAKAVNECMESPFS